MGETLRLCLWSGPRNVSTALMYSFRQRDDTRVCDEPLYGHYLKISPARHPAKAELLDQLDSDGERVVRELILGPCDRPVLFMKQMAHHLESLDWGFLARAVQRLMYSRPQTDAAVARQSNAPTDLAGYQPGHANPSASSTCAGWGKIRP